MSDANQESSTPDYVMGYAEGMVRFIERRTAEACSPQLLPHLKLGMRVLDVGCGPGTISVGLAAAVAPGEFIGIDMEQSQVDIASKRASDLGLTNAQFQVADALALPFPDDYFDAVHGHAVLMHIPDTLAALAEFKRVLKPGGFMAARELICESSFFEPDRWGMNEAFPMYTRAMHHNNGHPFLGKELAQRLITAGFEDVQPTASFEYYGTPEDIMAFAAFGMNYVCAEPFAEPAIANGIASREDFERWRAGIDEWKDEPGAFGALAWGEIIGRKPE